MQLVFPSLLAFVAYVAAQAADPSINTPAAVVQCQPAQITFISTRTPVFISIIPGGQPSAAPLADLGQQNASPFTWVANLPAGREITFQIRDSSGAVAYSAPVTIQNSSDSSCLGAGASSSAGGSSSAPVSSTSVAATSSAAASSSAAVSSASSASTSLAASTSSVIASVSSVISSATAPPSTSATRSASATSAAATPSTSPNSARTNAQVGFTGLLGLVAAAFMA